MFFLSEGFTFRNFLTDVFAVFMFVLWFWLLIIVIGDLFRRHDISGWGKAIWVIVLIVFPYLAIFAYLITQNREAWPNEAASRRSGRGTSFEAWSASAWPMRSRSSIGSGNQDRSRTRNLRGCVPSWFRS
jgi:hypothetical protein